MISMATAFFHKEKIITTEAKAKALRPFVEKYITRARAASLARRREVLRQLPLSTAKKIMEKIGPRYHSRAGGYTRITKLGTRKSDSAPLAILELV